MASKSFDLKYGIAATVHYYLLAMGVSSKRYDLQNRRVIKSRTATIYANVMAALLVLSLPVVSLVSLTYMSQYANNWVMRLTVQVNSAIRFVVVLLTVIGRWKRERRYERLTRIFYSIEMSYFKQLRQQSLSAYWERRFSFAYTLKFVTMCLQPMALVFGMWQLAKTSQLGLFLMSLYFGNLNFVINAVLFQYFTGMWHACKRFVLLSQQLRMLLESMQLVQQQAGQRLMKRSSTLSALSRLAAEDLKVIAKVHGQLTTLMLELNECFRTQTLGALGTYLIYNIMFGYYTWVVLTGSMRVELETWSNIFGLLLYVSLFVDLYMLYWTCEATTCAQTAPLRFLKGFNEFSALPTEFTRECESFAWQISTRQLAIKVAGMFTLNRHTALCFWAYIMQQTVVLIQFDYENRIEKQKEVSKDC